MLLVGAPGDDDPAEGLGAAYVLDGADLAPCNYVVRFEAAGEERVFTMTKHR